MQFSKIIKIYEIKEVYFYAGNIETIFFDTYFHAYKNSSMFTRSKMM